MLKTYLAFPALALLTACAGSPFSPTGTVHVAFDGKICGQPTKATLSDGKERQVFKMRVRCPGGGSFDIETSDSRAFEGQVAGSERDKALFEFLGRVLPSIPSIPGTGSNPSAGQ